MTPRSQAGSGQPAKSLRQARRRLLDDGAVVDTLLEPKLSASWRRSLDYGLSPAGRTPGAPHASAAQLARALDNHYRLVSHARPVMEFLADQTRDSDCMVILADAQGMLLHALGDPSFVDRAQRVALRPGAIWHERWRGTNAIGTALTESGPVVVRGGEHFLERNGFLSCAAAPIIDPAGRLLGVLDISGERRDFHRHTSCLVGSAARMIEHRLFDTWHNTGPRLRMHTHREGIGTVAEGLIALSEDGWIVGADVQALDSLGIGREQIGRLTIDRVLPIDPSSVGMLAARPGGTTLEVTGPRGRLWVRLEAPSAARPMRPSSATDTPPVDRSDGGHAARSTEVDVHPAPPSTFTTPAGIPAMPEATSTPEHAAIDPLAALDTGDPRLHAAIDRARRVLDKPIAVLLRGESGTGKEWFARAFHGSGARSRGPFVAVNCAAIPESLIEAELFGYQPGAFTDARREGTPGRIREADGGTLFLDEIGDMPLPLQTRLLRVLQERVVSPLGGGAPVAVDFRLVCATHQDLRQAMAQGRFREDLYYRLNGLTITLPSLRERTDLPALVRRMLDDRDPDMPRVFSPAVMGAMTLNRWPGNLRELCNAVHVACALADPGDPVIDWAHLPDDLASDLRAVVTPRMVSSAEDPAAR